MAQIMIKPIRFGAPVAQALVAAAMRDLAERYGSEDETPVDPTAFDPPEGGFVVAYLDGVPVGCGGWRSHGDTDDVAEIKRMYTAPQARSRGVARAVLAAVEESARSCGRKRLILETGNAQPEAVAFYACEGYERIPNFGYYRGEEGCVSFGRTL
ncbi:MAG TPA: GNAT family N-acetyltransferase [Micromonosporaceae bacterium]|nr:GNAT family N-acetyltransferase [Micromonosporaceae bacterium]